MDLSKSKSSIAEDPRIKEEEKKCGGCTSISLGPCDLGRKVDPDIPMDKEQPIELLDFSDNVIDVTTETQTGIALDKGEQKGKLLVAASSIDVVDLTTTDSCSSSDDGIVIAASANDSKQAKTANPTFKKKREMAKVPAKIAAWFLKRQNNDDLEDDNDDDLEDIGLPRVDDENECGQKITGGDLEESPQFRYKRPRTSPSTVCETKSKETDIINNID